MGGGQRRRREGLRAGGHFEGEGNEEEEQQPVSMEPSVSLLRQMLGKGVKRSFGRDGELEGTVLEVKTVMQKRADTDAAEQAKQQQQQQQQQQ